MRVRRGEQRQQHRLEGHKGGGRDERNERSPEAQRAHERHGDEDEDAEPDCDGDRGVRNGSSRRGHRADDHVVVLSAPLELGAEAVDAEQRVVDRERQPDQDDEVLDVGRHAQRVRQRVDDRKRPADRAGREDERDQQRGGDTEHERQNEERDR